jgi:hypothetical protein
MGKIQRRDDMEKCPACGWRLDAGAYRCPKCRIYFCYKCRARVGERETQYQCADQSCDCYGKLLCAACVVPIDQPVPHPNSDATIAALIGGGIAGAASLAVAPVAVAAGLGVGAIALGTWGLRAMGFNVWGSKDLTHAENIQHLGCIQCRHPVKHLR